MLTLTRHLDPRSDRRSTSTAPGRVLRACWIALIGYGMWAAWALPEHPEQPIALEAALGTVGLLLPITAAGLVLRRRWAMQLSAGLAVPLMGLAVMCFVADAGLHWVPEAGLALGIAACSLHPGSWRMHSR